MANGVLRSTAAMTPGSIAASRVPQDPAPSSPCSKIHVSSKCLAHLYVEDRPACTVRRVVNYIFCRHAGDRALRGASPEREVQRGGVVEHGME